MHTSPAATRQPILVVGADSCPGRYLGLLESQLGATVQFAPSVGEAVQRVLAAPPCAVVVFGDDGDASETCAILRALGHFPIAVLPRMLSEDAAAACLDRGADIALTAPVPAVELVARLQAAIRRSAEPASVVRAGDIVIDFERGEVRRQGEPVGLTPTEFRLLAVLAERAGRVVSPEELLRRVWGEDYVDDLQYVRLYIGYLRAKLEPDPAHPRLIVTHRALGYRLVPSPSSNGASPSLPGTASR